MAATEAVPERNKCELTIYERRLIPDPSTLDAIADYARENSLVIRVTIVPAKGDWRQPFITYLKYGILLEDLKEIINIEKRTPGFYFNEVLGTLHYRSYDGLLLRCLSEEERSNA